MPRILIVEDEPTLRHLLVQNLSSEGFEVQAVTDGEEALYFLGRHATDLVVLDLMLPKADGFQVLQSIRKAGNPVAVMMLTARGTETDRLRGLRLGADDYLVKPFSILELVARIQAILRRTAPVASTSVRTGPLQIHFGKRQVFHEGNSLNLTAQEFRLVEILVGSPGTPFSREEILALAWEGEQTNSPHRLNVHISNLRKKLAEASREEFIATAGRVGRGGYLWALPVTGDTSV